MNRLLKYVLIALLAGHGHTIRTMKKQGSSVPTVELVEDDAPDQRTIPSNTTAGSTTVVTQPKKTPGLTVASLSKNNQGNMDVTVHTDTLPRVVDVIVTGVTQAANQLAPALDATGNILAAKMELAGTAGAQALDKMAAVGTVALNEATDIVVVKFKEGVTALATAGESPLITQAKTAGKELLTDAQVITTAATTGATNVMQQVVTVVTTAATPENIAASKEVAQGVVQTALANPHVGSFIDKAGDSAKNFMVNGAELLKKGNEASGPAIEAVKNVHTASQQLPGLMNEMFKTLQNVNRTLNPQQAIEQPQSEVTIDDITDDHIAQLLALPAPQRLQDQADLAYVVITNNKQPSPTDLEFLKEVGKVHKDEKIVDVKTFKQLQQMAKKVQQNKALLLTAGQAGNNDTYHANIKIEEIDEKDTPANNNPQKIALLKKQRDELAQQFKSAVEQVRPTNQTPKTWSSFMVAPHPAFLFAACVAVAGSVVVARKMYIKWKKNKEKKEKRKAHKAGSKKAHEEEPEIVV